jgi:hypothetical protein
VAYGVNEEGKKRQRYEEILAAGCEPVTFDRMGRGIIWNCPAGTDLNKLGLE